MKYHEPYSEADGYANSRTTNGKGDESGDSGEAGSAHPRLHHVEAGRQDPSLSTINALAKALGVPVATLLE